MTNMPVWQEGEEFANSITHGIGACLALIGTGMLFNSGKRSHNRYKFAGNVIFGISMLTLYLSSCIYHGLKNMHYKKMMRYVDHCSIFIFIAGTYAPFTLTLLKNKGGLIIFPIVLIVSLCGIFGKLFFFDLIDPYSIYIFIALGWVSLFILKPICMNLCNRGKFFLVLGGLLYTISTYFFNYDQEIAWYHAIFHLISLVGSICHFICVMYYC